MKGDFLYSVRTKPLLWQLKNVSAGSNFISLLQFYFGQPVVVCPSTLIYPGLEFNFFGGALDWRYRSLDSSVESWC